MVYVEVVLKYWNKQKYLRESKWYKVSLERDDPVPNLFAYYDGWTSWPAFLALKNQLQKHNSNGKFYMSIAHKDIYFELERDAVYFSLTYL